MSETSHDVYMLVCILQSNLHYTNIDKGMTVEYIVMLLNISKSCKLINLILTIL